MHTTNYYNTFIEVAEDCPAKEAEVPKMRGGKKSVPVLQYEMIVENPYRFTSDDVVFRVHAIRKGLDPDDKREREIFFSKGQPCLRCSSLGKRYGWGIHSDENGKVALYARESDAYTDLIKNKQLNLVMAMRNSRKKE